MTLLMNPTALRMGLLLFAAIAAFGLGLFTIRLLRKNLLSESDSLNSSPLAPEGLPVHAYHAVIQQLKQQKHELAAQQLSDRRKAKASDTLSSTILSNLSCGVLFLNTAGLVRQANAAGDLCHRNGVQLEPGPDARYPDRRTGPGRNGLPARCSGGAGGSRVGRRR